MQAIILVDGSVTFVNGSTSAFQLDLIRREALIKGLDPVLQRFSITESRFTAGGAFVNVIFDDDTVDFEGKVAERMTKWLDFKGASLFAIVASEPDHYYDGLVSLTKIIQRLEQDFQYWVAREDDILERC